jgi:hypothetical protein
MVELDERPQKRARLHRVQPIGEPVQVDNDDVLTVISNEHFEVAEPEEIEFCCQRSPPKSFFCPLTMEIMFDPVLDSDGNTYERLALMEWLKENRTSPISRQPLSDRMVIPNIALCEAIHEFMGSEWVSGKTAEKRQDFLAEKQGAEDPLPGNVEKPASTVRAKIDCYLRSAADEHCGVSLRLNHEGCSAFRYDNVTIVLDVPEHSGIFCFYTRDLLPKNMEDSVRDKICKRALELNFLQVDTRGGCLSIRNHANDHAELVFSYTDRVGEITAKDFSNIFRSFIKTTLNLRDRLTL